LYHKKTRKILFSHEKATKNFLCTKKQRKILLARGLSIRQLPALGCWMQRFCCCSCCCR